MSELSASPSKLPPEQEAIRAKCFHPTGTFVEFPKEEVEQSIPVRFEKIVARCSDRVAVKDKSQQLTYELLNKTANRMARSLLAQRGKGEEPIAVLFEQGPLGIAAVLGVLKAGKMVVPLDPCYPRASIRYTIEDSQAALIVTNSQNFSLASDLAKNAARILNVDDIDSNFSTEDLETAISPDALAYILYTSGSTGQPKGLVQKHRNVLHQIRNNTNTLHICADDRLTLFTSVTGQAINTMLVALLNGASVCSFNIKEEGPTYLPAWLRQQEITVYSSVATVYRSFVAGLLAGSQFPSLRIIYLGGEPVYKADIELYKNFSPPGCVYISRFGISEAGSVSYYFINKKTIIAGDSVPVGYAAEDMQLLLLDDDGQELGGNRTGQIAVKSRFLSPGYWRRPEATRAAFLNDPRGGDDRVYLTGDLGRMLPDGCLIHCGRKDFRVKVRGYGVEPAEIERALLGIDTVKEAVVVGQDFIPGEQRLVAYLVAKRDTAPTISTVRRALAQKLPSYKIPSAFIMVEARSIARPFPRLTRRGQTWTLPT